jgi:hypothetical protein
MHGDGLELTLVFLLAAVVAVPVFRPCWTADFRRRRRWPSLHPCRDGTPRALFADTLPDDLIEEIRSYLQQQKALGPRRSNCP